MNYMLFKGRTLSEGDIIAPEEEVTFEGFQYSFEYWDEYRWEKIYSLDHIPVIYIAEKSDRNGNAYCVFKESDKFIVAFNDPDSDAFFVEEYFSTFNDAIAFIES